MFRELVICIVNKISRMQGWIPTTSQSPLAATATTMGAARCTHRHAATSCHSCLRALNLLLLMAGIPGRPHCLRPPRALTSSRWRACWQRTRLHYSDRHFVSIVDNNGPSNMRREQWWKRQQAQRLPWSCNCLLCTDDLIALTFLVNAVLSCLFGLLCVFKADICCMFDMNLKME